tara:strand:- start:384 stop:1844 length:1461 start_codon:yes stop_codon:yes gene_type:complete
MVPKNSIKKVVIVLSLLSIISCSSNKSSVVENDDLFFINNKLIQEKSFLQRDTLKLEELSDDQFLERIQYDYTKSILTKKDSIATTEKDGYKINLFCIGVTNNWFSREDAAKEVLKYLKEFENSNHIKGFLPRSFSRKTGKKIKGNVYGKFGQPYDVVGTAFLATSLKFIIRQFFKEENEIENEIRELCDVICNRIDWNFAYRKDKKCFTWFKNGKNGTVFDGKNLIGEMDETFFLQLLVLGSKKWSYGNEAYKNYVSKIFVDNQYGYSYFSTKQYDYKNSKQFTGIKVNNSEILKLNNYPTAKLGYLVQSHIWFDLANYRDSVCQINNMDYFQGVQNAVKAQIKYAQINPGKNKLYGDVWGFYDTFSPISKKWMVTGLPAEGDFDEGTIAISAVMSAINFQPKESIQCLRKLYTEFKDVGIYKEDGFVMSVNTNTREVAKNADYFFQPITVLSIENHRSGLLWELAKKAPEYQIAFKKAGLKYHK